MKVNKEARLEPLVREIRFYKGLKFIHKKATSTNPIIADLGCGPQIRFHQYLRKNGISVKNYFGLDPLLDKQVLLQYKNHEDIQLINSPLDKKIDLPSNSVDVIVGFAFLEHINYPGEIVTESVRVLKSGGIAIFTTPTRAAKAVLEFLSFKMGLISKREIDEHKQYFWKRDLVSLLLDNKDSVRIDHSYFEFGMNNLFCITKP